MEKISNIINNNRQPKKRISKACIKCKNSKNKCINIEKGVCERCVELNEICIYDYSHGNIEDDSKVMISKEYLTLLQNKSMLTELILKTLFNDFDKLANSGILTINNTTEVDDSLKKQRDLWSLLINKNYQFCNPQEVNTNYNHMTTKYKSNLEINPLIQLILPSELYSAMNAINSIGKNNLNDLFDHELDKKIDTNTSIVTTEPVGRKRRRNNSKSEEVVPASRTNVNVAPPGLLPTFNRNGLLGFNTSTHLKNTFHDFNKSTPFPWVKEGYRETNLLKKFDKSHTLVNDFLSSQSNDLHTRTQFGENMKNKTMLSEPNASDKGCKVKMDLKMILND